MKWWDYLRFEDKSLLQQAHHPIKVFLLLCNPGTTQPIVCYLRGMWTRRVVQVKFGGDFLWITFSLLTNKQTQKQTWITKQANQTNRHVTGQSKRLQQLLKTRDKSTEFCDKCNLQSPFGYPATQRFPSPFARESLSQTAKQNLLKFNEIPTVLEYNIYPDTFHISNVPFYTQTTVIFVLTNQNGGWVEHIS